MTVGLRSSSGVVLFYFWVTWILFETAEAEPDNAWENVFRSRNDDEWRAVWHTEKHRRCYHDLYSHMGWVCQKDIYAVRKRTKSTHFRLERALNLPFRLYKMQSQPPSHDFRDEDFEDKDFDSDDPFLEEEKAFSLLGNPRYSRRDLYKRGIIDECCHVSTGCNWEEYAEYCPANSRSRGGSQQHIS